MQASVTVERGGFAPPPVAEPEEAPRPVRRPTAHEMDAACALLLEGEKMSVRDAGALLGMAHSNVAARAKRYAETLATVPEHLRLCAWAAGYVAGRRSGMDERLRAAPESWEDRLSRLVQSADADWQSVHVMPYDSATSSVSKLRLSRHGIERGGSWQFRVEKDGAEGKVMAIWCGTPCTGCGAVSLDERVCPICGCDKEGA